MDEEAGQYVQKLHGIDVEPLPRYLRKYLKDDNGERMSVREQASLRKEKKYDGAFVLDPKPGLYDKVHVCTFDFASLYPSIMISSNLCFSTWIEHRYCSTTGQIWFPYYDDGPDKRSTDKYFLWYAGKERPTPEQIAGRTLILVCVDETTGYTYCFVQDVPSLLPGILKELTALRKKVKKEMEAAESAYESAKKAGNMTEAAFHKLQSSVLDSRQAAIKVLCNSSYGFCGSTAGYFGMIPIAIVTCFMGRLAILKTKSIVEHKYKGIVIYGDTDSVFCVFPQLENQPNKTRSEIFADVSKLCHEACAYITKLLPSPMKLEFEKAFRVFLMMEKKKQYAGMFCWPKEKFLIKGMAPVRRDCCVLAAECGMETLRAALEQPYDTEALLGPLTKALNELAVPTVPLVRLQKTVAKRAAYKGNADRLIQKVLFDKIKSRTGVEVETGSRVAYIVTLPKDGQKRVRSKDDKLYRDGEETAHCQDMGIEPDREYYVQKQIEGPVLRYLKHRPDLQPKINRLVQGCLDTIWVQNTRNKLIQHYFRRQI